MLVSVYFKEKTPLLGFTNWFELFLNDRSNSKNTVELNWSQVQSTFGQSLEGLPEGLVQKGWSASGSTARTEVCGPMTQNIRGYDSLQAPWYFILHI